MLFKNIVAFKFALLSLTIFLASFCAIPVVFAQSSDQVSQLYVRNVTLDKTTYNAGDTIKGAFDLFNPGKIDASDMYYRIKLIGNFDKNNAPQNVFDQGVLSGPIFIPAGKAVSQSFSYVLPMSIDGSSAGLEIQAVIKTGQPLSWVDKRFDFVASSAAFSIDGLSIKIGKDYILPSVGPMVYPNQTVSLVADTSNSAKTSVTVVTKISIQNFSDLTAKPIYATTSTAVAIAGKSKKTFTYNLPLFDRQPGVYVGTIQFFDLKGGSVSSSLTFRYMVQGDMATIQSVTLDTSSSTDNTVRVSTIISGAPQDPITSKNIIIGTTTVAVSLYDQNDNLVGQSSGSVELVDLSRKDITISLNSKVDSLKAVVTVTKSGKVLATYTTSRVPVKKSVTANNFYLWITLLIALIVVVLAVLLKRKMTTKIVKVFAFILLAAGAVTAIGLQTHKVHAATTGPDSTITGSFDGVSPDGYVYGWAVDTANPSRTVYVSFKTSASSIPVENIPADEPSADVTAVFPQYTGNHRFKILLRGYDFSDGHTYNISVYGAPQVANMGNYILPGPTSFTYSAANFSDCLRGVVAACPGGWTFKNYGYTDPGGIDYNISPVGITTNIQSNGQSGNTLMSGQPFVVSVNTIAIACSNSASAAAINFDRITDVNGAPAGSISDYYTHSNGNGICSGHCLTEVYNSFQSKQIIAPTRPGQYFLQFTVSYTTNGKTANVFGEIPFIVISTNTPPSCADSQTLTYAEALAARDAGTLKINLGYRPNVPFIARATIQNNTGCSLPVSMATYSMFDNKSAQTQKLYDKNGPFTVVSGDTFIFDAQLASCLTQVDLFYGPPVLDFYNGNGNPLGGIILGNDGVTTFTSITSTTPTASMGFCPNPPMTITATAGTSCTAPSINLSWTTIYNATSYQLYTGLDFINPGATFLQNSASNTYTDTGLVAGSRHGYEVTAYRGSTPLASTLVFANATNSCAPATTVTLVCPAPGTAGTVSWAPLIGYSAYYLRVYDITTAIWVVPPAPTVTTGLGATSYTTVFSDDNATTLSKTFNATVGHEYASVVWSKNTTNNSPGTPSAQTIKCLAVTPTSLTVNLQATTPVVSGSATTLTWSATNASGCSASSLPALTWKTNWVDFNTGLPDPVKMFGGTQQVVLTAPADFTYTCTGNDLSTKSVTKHVDVTALNTPPTPPVIGGPQTGAPNTSYTYTFRGTDPDVGDKIHYGVDWDNNGTVDQWLPTTAIDVSSTTESQPNNWAAVGTKTFQALTEDVSGARSGWTSYSVVINNIPGALVINLQATTPVVSGSATTLTWSATNASGCSASSVPAFTWKTNWVDFNTGLTDPKMFGGTQQVLLTAPADFTYTCTGNDLSTKSVTKHVDVTGVLPSTPGVCDTAHYKCSTSVPSDPSTQNFDGNNTYTWTCPGVNGGLSKSCTEVSTGPGPGPGPNPGPGGGGDCRPQIKIAGTFADAKFANVGQLVQWTAIGAGPYVWSLDGVTPLTSQTSSIYPTRYSTIGNKKVYLNGGLCTIEAQAAATDGTNTYLPVINDPNYHEF